MDALSFIGRRFRVHSHDHGGRYDIVARSREDMRLPLALLDLVVHAACLCPHVLRVEVLRARTSVVMVFICLLSFMSPSSFQVLLVILHLFPGAAWNRIGIILHASCHRWPIFQEVQHVALCQQMIAPLRIGLGIYVPFGHRLEVIDRLQILLHHPHKPRGAWHHRMSIASG